MLPICHRHWTHDKFCWLKRSLWQYDFSFIDSQLENFTEEIRQELDQGVAEINSYTTAIAELNEKIVEASGDAETQPPNDLLDQRDELIRKLSELVSVSTVVQNDGSMNVFSGKGQALVLGQEASNLDVTQSYFGHFDITLTTSFSTSVITDNITGGSVGGLIDFQENMLEPVRNSLGRLAIGLAETFNEQHNLGMNIDGEIDVDFFTVGVPEVLPMGSSIISGGSNDCRSVGINDQ